MVQSYALKIGWVEGGGRGAKREGERKEVICKIFSRNMNLVFVSNLEFEPT